MLKRLAIAATMLIASLTLVVGPVGTAHASSFKNVQAPTMSQCHVKLRAVTTDLRRAGYVVTKQLCKSFGYQARGTVWYTR